MVMERMGRRSVGRFNISAAKGTCKGTKGKQCDLESDFDSAQPSAFAEVLADLGVLLELVWALQEADGFIDVTSRDIHGQIPKLVSLETLQKLSPSTC